MADFAREHKRGMARRNAKNVPDGAWLRPRDIYSLWPSITPALLRKWRSTGQVVCKRFGENEHPFYIAGGIKRLLGIPVEKPKEATQAATEIATRQLARANKPGQRLAPQQYAPLLRLRDVMNVGLSRDEIEIWVQKGLIKPFYKARQAKALYPTWQLKRLLEFNMKIRAAPRTKRLRRRQVLDWLGVPAAEIESWVRLGWISRHQGCYDRDEVIEKILAQERGISPNSP
jgi:hypothetical protein